MSNLRKILLGIILGFVSNVALASHIRSIDIQWSVPDPVNSPLRVELVVTEVGRASFPWGNPATDSLTVVVRNDMAAVINSVTVNLSKVGEGVDAANGAGSYDGNYLVLRGAAAVTLPALGSYQASASSCCTASNMANSNNDKDYGAVAKIVLDGQRGGPVAAVQPIINLTRGSVQTVRFPMFDPDGDPVTCRFATSAEAFNLPTPTPVIGTTQATVSTVDNECELSWDLTAVNADSFHFLPLVIESMHNGKVSSIGVDRMLLVTNKIYPTCAGGGYIGLQPNQVFSTQFVGAASSNISFAVTGAPAGSTFSPASGASGSSPMPVDFSWTPTSGQAGSSYIMQAVFKDTSNVEGQCNYVVNVDALNPVLTLDTPADVPVGTAAELVGQVTNRTSGTVQITLIDSSGQTHLIPATISSSGGWQALSPSDLPIGAVQVSVELDGFAVLPTTGAFEVLAVAPALTGVAPNGHVGSAYSFTPDLGPANLTLPVTITLSGALPDGLIFNASTGSITGTPMVAGSFPVAIQATNVKASSTLNLTLLIAQAISGVNITSSVNPSLPGQSVTFTISVAFDSSKTALSQKAAPVPTGTISLVDGSTFLGTTAVVNGVATISTTQLRTVGIHNIVASYGGDANYVAEDSPVFAQTVDPVVVTPVPTLSQWALAMLSLVMVGFATMGLSRSRMR